MVDADLIIHNARQLLTCASAGGPKRRAEMLDVGIVPDGAVAILEGKFAAVGTSNEILATYQSDLTLDAGGGVICPGFADPHTHIVYAGDRLDEFELKIKGAAYLDILAAGGGIISTVKDTREARLETLVDLAFKRLDRMLECGTTSCEIKTGYGLETDTELKMLAAIEELDNRHAMTIVPTFLAAHAVPPEFKENSNAYIDLICSEMLQRAWEWFVGSRFHGERPFFCDVFCEAGAFSVEQSRKVLETAKSLGFKVKAHVDQFTNLGGARFAIANGAVSVDHLDTISDEEIGMLADSDTIGVVIPTENFNAGKTRFAPARKMIDEGCAVAITTDFNPGSAPCPSQPMAMAIASRYQKLGPAECFNAATINAAYAIGLGRSHGSIEAGKSADLLVLGATDYRQVVQEFGGNLVSRVFKGGREVLHSS